MLRSLRRLSSASLPSLCVLALGASALGCGGFDIGAGDVAVFRVGYAEGNQSDGCYPNDTPPPDDGDASNLRSGQTAIVYAAAAEDAEPTYYLDLGGVVLEGTQGEEGVYTFTGQDKDVERIGGGTIQDADHDGQDDNGADGFVDADGDNLEDRGEDDLVDADLDGLDDRFEDDSVDTNGDGIHDYEFIDVPGDTALITTSKYAVSMSVTEEGVSGTYEVTQSNKCEGPSCPTDEDEACKTTTTFVGVWVEEATVDVSFGNGNPTP
jgi:hypothetical protein